MMKRVLSILLSIVLILSVASLGLFSITASAAAIAADTVKVIYAEGNNREGNIYNPGGVGSGIVYTFKGTYTYDSLGWRNNFYSRPRYNDTTNGNFTGCTHITMTIENISTTTAGYTAAQAYNYWRDHMCIVIHTNKGWSNFPLPLLENGSNSVKVYVDLSVLGKNFNPKTVDRIGIKTIPRGSGITYDFNNGYLDANAPDFRFHVAKIYGVIRGIENVHTVYSNEVSTDPSNLNLDFSKAKCDIDLGNVSGPKIKIFGHEFDLLKFKNELKIDLGSTGVSITRVVDNNAKTVRVLVGYTKKEQEKLQNHSKFDTEYKTLKNIYKALSGNNSYYTIPRNETIKKLLGKTGNLGVKAEFKPTGYIEFSYETGKMIPTESGIIILGEVGVTYTYQPSIFYVTTGLKGSADATINFAIDQNWNARFKSIALQSKLTANIGVGIGSKLLGIYGEGGLIGELAGNLSTDFINSIDYKLTLSGSLYIEAKAVLYTYKTSWTYYKEDLINKTFSLKSAKRGTLLDDSAVQSQIGRKYNYTKTQDTVSGTKGLLRGILLDNTVFSQNNIYPYSMPVYLNLDDGRRMVIWVGDDGTKSDNNRTSIMYSICDNRVWSQPAVLQDNGRYNDMPCAYTDGENVYLVWQRAKNVFGDDIEIENAVSQMDLYYSVFDGSAFSSPVCITDYDNEIYEDTMSIYSENGTQIVSWQQNDENAIFEDSGNNSLHYRLCQDGIWQDATEVLTTDQQISEQASNIENNVPVLYYVINGETNTLYRYDINAQTTTEIANGETVNSISVVNGKVYYLCDGYLFAYTGDSTLVTDLQLSNYQIVTNGEREALFTLISSGLKNALYSCERDSSDESFGNLTLFADYDTNIRNYYAVMDDNGLTSVAVNSVEVDEDNIQSLGEVYGSADLFVTEKENYYDIGVDYLSYNPDDVLPSENLEFNYQVTNYGNVTQNGFTAALYRNDGTLITSEYIDYVLEPGQSEEFIISYLLPENISKQDITLIIQSAEDNYVDNNTTVATIGLADVSFSDLSVYADGDKAILSGYVENNGYDIAEDIMVSVSKFNEDEKEEITAINIGSISGKGRVKFTAELPEDMFMTDNPYVMNGVYLSVETSSIEASVSNNDDKIVYDTLATGTYDSLTYSFYNEGGLYFTGSGILHNYDIDDNPFNIYRDRITDVHLEDTIECDHRYTSGICFCGAGAPTDIEEYNIGFIDKTHKFVTFNEQNKHEIGFESAKDITDTKMIELDVYMNGAGFDTGIAICDSLGNSALYNFTGLKAGWNHLAIRVSDLVQHGSNTANVDLSNISKCVLSGNAGEEVTVANLYAADYVEGDANRDGVLDIRDVVRAKKMAAGDTAEGNKLAVSGDDYEINAVDLTNLIHSIIDSLFV